MEGNNKTEKNENKKNDSEEIEYVYIDEQGNRSTLVSVLRILSFTIVSLAILFFGYRIFKEFDLMDVTVLPEVEKDLTYIIEEQKPVMNLELLKRTVTAAVDKNYKKTFTLKPPLLSAQDYQFNAYAEVKCPVTYIYYVDLNREWKITYQKEKAAVYVSAPEVRVHEPIMQTQYCKERFEGNPIFFNREKILGELRKSLTIEFTVIGETQKDLSYVREDCRRQLEEFIKIWVMKEEKVEFIQVSFKDDEEITLGEAPLERDERELEIRRRLSPESQ